MKTTNQLAIIADVDRRTIIKRARNLGIVHRYEPQPHTAPARVFTESEVKKILGYDTTSGPKKKK